MKKKCFRLLSMLLCCLLTFAAALPVTAEEELELASQAAVLMDADTGTVLYQKNMHQVLYPASITKLMTALLALQNLETTQILTVSQAAVNAVPRTSSHISLLPGERFTVEEALYAIGMESANDAANVLAEAVAGSLDAFAEKMNETARSLGALHTNFTNANGLPDSSHATTAYDMALITAAAWKQEGLAAYFSTVTHTFPATNLSSARSFQNKNRLLAGGQYYYDGVQMAKTGWTSSAQGTFAAVVKKGDVTLVAVTLKSPLLEDKYRDTHKLMDYGFSHYSRVTVSGEQIAVGLDLGDYTAVSGQKQSYLIPAGLSMGDIRYALENVDLETEKRDKLTVTVSASLGELRLPDATLKLERPPQPRVTYTLSELLTTKNLDAATVWNTLRIPAITLGVLLLIALTLLLRRQFQRHKQRRHLKARIRRMKKRMEP